MHIDVQRLSAFAESDDYEQGTKIINKLLSHWCIPRWKDAESRQDWAYITQRAEELKDILNLSGYTMNIVEARGREVVYISANETISTFQKMSKAEATTFLCLRMLYEEHMKKATLDSNALNAKVAAEELLTTVCVYKKNPVYRAEMRELRAVLTKMEDINVCRIEGARKDFGPESIITIFPSVTALLPAAAIEDITAMLDEYKAETTKKTYASSENSLDIDEEE